MECVFGGVRDKDLSGTGSIEEHHISTPGETSRMHCYTVTEHVCGPEFQLILLFSEASSIAATFI